MMAFQMAAQMKLIITIISALSACIQASPVSSSSGWTSWGSDETSSAKKSADFVIIGGKASPSHSLTGSDVSETRRYCRLDRRSETDTGEFHCARS